MLIYGGPLMEYPADKIAPSIRPVADKLSEQLGEKGEVLDADYLTRYGRGVITKDGEQVGYALHDNSRVVVLAGRSGDLRIPQNPLIMMVDCSDASFPLLRVSRAIQDAGLDLFTDRDGNMALRDRNGRMDWVDTVTYDGIVLFFLSFKG